MNTSICFIANFSKTYLFHAIAQELTLNGGRIHWICTNIKLYKFLKRHYPFEHILYINRTIKDKNEPLQDFKINEIIYGDRVLRNEAVFGEKFLNNIQQPIYQFLKKQQIKWVFGEITWAHEVLIHRMCSQLKELNCTFLNPHVVRIPSHRFAFFKDERQSQLFEISTLPTKEYPTLKVQEPSYSRLNRILKKKNNSLYGRLDKVRRFITNENMDPKDPTLIVNEWTRFITRFKEEYRKEIYKFLKKEQQELLHNRPYVYIGLHKQPEASVDVFGRYYEDQLQNIINIWRVLPSGWKIAIKEHPMAIGDRPLSFYKSLKKLPNLVLLQEQEISHYLIKKAKLVVTITGTMAYEAALMGVPSATFAPAFFNQLHLCEQIDLGGLSTMTNLEQWIANIKASVDNRLHFSNYIMKHSFSGRLIDPITDKTVLEEENVKQLAIGFKTAIGQQLETVQKDNIIKPPIKLTTAA